MRSVLLVLSALTLSAADQTPARPAEGDPGLAIEQLRAALRARDFEGGLRESDSLVQQFPSSPELGALHVALMEQAGVGLTEETEDLGLTAEAQDAADSLARRFPHIAMERLRTRDRQRAARLSAEAGADARRTRSRGAATHRRAHRAQSPGPLLHGDEQRS